MLNPSGVYRVAELAELTEAVVVGDPDRLVRGTQPFETASAADVTLAADPGFLQRLDETKAGCVVIDSRMEPDPSNDKSFLKVENPRLAFARIRAHLQRQPFQPQGISPLASIAGGARISKEVTIHPFVRVGEGSVIEDQVTLHSGVAVGDDCHIGFGSTLFPNVSLYLGTRLGKGVRIHSGSVIGADGFGYIFDGERQFKVLQSGHVEIGDEVEIGANCCIDRATFGATVLEEGVKLDNLVHIGHNCHVGAHTVVVGCVGISGSVRIGKRCVLAGQCGIVDHVTIGDDVTVMGKTVVPRDVPSGSVISGPFGRDHREQLRIEAVLRKLPELARDVRTIKAVLNRVAQSGRQEERE